MPKGCILTVHEYCQKKKSRASRSNSSRLIRWRRSALLRGVLMPPNGIVRLPKTELRSGWTG